MVFNNESNKNDFVFVCWINCCTNEFNNGNSSCFETKYYISTILSTHHVPSRQLYS